MKTEKSEPTGNQSSTLQLTKEQNFFYLKMKRMKQLECMEPMTWEAKAERNKILSELWGVIHNFALKEAYRMLGPNSKDGIADVSQCMALIFFERLPYYDPTQTTPTTYFVQYFHQVISQYIQENHAI